VLPCEAIEAAILAALRTAFSGSEHDVMLRPFVAETDEAAIPPLARPCVQFACDPFAPVQPGAPIGTCTARLEASTSCVDDPGGRQLQAIYEAATGVMLAATLGPLVMSPHLVSGVNDASGEGGVSIDEDQRYRRKGKTYDVAVATIGS